MSIDIIEKLSPPGTEGSWLSLFLDLRASGLYWKKAAFAAWHAAPKHARQPATMRELAAALGYKSEQVLYKWKHQEWFRECGVSTLRQQLYLHHLPDVDRQTFEKAASPDGSHLDRKLFYDQLQQALQDAVDPDAADVTVDVTFRRALEKAYGDDDQP